MKENKTVLVVFSGGQDSTTCLIQALNAYGKVEAICFDYGQKHIIELDAAYKICQRFDVPFTLIKTDIFKQIGDSALLSDSKQDVNETHTHHSDLPASFVPGRNLYFLTAAAMYAHKKGIHTIITGVSQEDYSGYPDCRNTTIQTLNVALILGMDFDVTIETPLINMSKSDEVTLMMSFDDGEEALSMTHTCYNGSFPPCGTCPSCKLRAKAFKEAGFQDPLIKKLKRQG